MSGGMSPQSFLIDGPFIDLKAEPSNLKRKISNHGVEYFGLPLIWLKIEFHYRPCRLCRWNLLDQLDSVELCERITR